MPLKTWQNFGGRDADQPGYRPAENDLQSWAAAENFTAEQAQAVLCSDDVYSASFRKRLEVPKELCAHAVQRHNKHRRSLSVSEQEQIPSVGMLKFFVNPMHLLVQVAYLAAKVSFVIKGTLVRCKCLTQGPDLR